MGRIGQYLLSIVSAALLVSICNMLVENKSAIGSVIKLITGIVLAMLVVAPWTDIRFEPISESLSYAEAEAASIVQQGEETARGEIAAYIKKQTEAYILDKAFALGLDITVDVVLTEDIPPSVTSVMICGSAAPYTKKQMILQICEDFGVTEECIVWSQNIG